MSDVKLEAINLSKRYDEDTLALDNVSFQVRTGELFCMLGGNGAGKTTTINIFLNFIEPTSGEAQICGISTHTDPLSAKAHVAYVAENVMLYANFTAVQNLEFFVRLGGRTDVTRGECREALLRVGLHEAFHNKRLKDFSKGMRQKCGIAIAILKNASTIILDEPTSGLDPQAGHEFSQLVRSLRDEGKAILMSTHDIFRAREIADTIAIMNHGKLVMMQPAAELASANLEQLYLEHILGSQQPTLEGAA